MNQRTAYLTQIIEKIGGPLLNAVSTQGGANSQDASVSKDQAEQLAILLAKTVQLSITLGKMIEIEKTEPELSDSLRVAMAGLAAPIVADQYKNLNKAPSDADMDKLSSALEAVMTFSDNFSPSIENTERLKNIQANSAPVDAHQVQIQYIQAFVPVADIIARFPFGQATKKMVQDTTEKLTGRAKTMRTSVFANITDQDSQKFCELGILKALTELYVSCHTQEMEKLMRLQEPDANAQSQALKALWDNFDMRAETLQSLAENLVPQNAQSSTSSSSGDKAPVAAPPQTAQPPAQSPPPVQPPQQATEQAAAPPTPPTEQSAAPPVFQKPQGDDAQASPPTVPPQAAQPPVSPPAQETPPPATPPTAPPAESGQVGGNPMSMFAKPGDNQAPTAPPAAPPQQPATEQPASTPPPVQPPQEAQVQQPPAQETPQESSGDNASGGGPMSFFKTPPKGEDGS